MADHRLLGLVLLFVPLSLLSFGGGTAVIADMQHQTVGVWGWMNGSQFNDLYAISRAAPGPMTLIAALIGYQASGFAGAIVGALAIYVPSCAAFYWAASWWQKQPDSRLKRSLKRGLEPVAIGLLFAGALAIIEAGPMTPITLLNTLICIGILYFTKFSPYKLVGAVGLVFFGLNFAGF